MGLPGAYVARPNLPLALQVVSGGNVPITSRSSEYFSERDVPPNQGERISYPKRYSLRQAMTPRLIQNGPVLEPIGGFNPYFSI